MMIDLALYGISAILFLLVLSFVALCCVEIGRSFRSMKNLLLTMHTTDEQDRLWITCSCGWETEPVKISLDEEWEPSKRALADLGRSHLQEKSLD
jgi:hypothetical protein